MNESDQDSVFVNIVVESAEKGGSLVTAHIANSYHRDVFAVPGSLNNTQAVGCNSLLKQGAILTSSAQDIIDNLNLNLSKVCVARVSENNQAHAQVAENNLSVKINILSLTIERE